MLPVNPQFFNYSIPRQKIAKLTNVKVAAIEDSRHLQLAEKVNLVALLLGHKCVTDVAIDVSDKAEVKKLLSKLGLPFAANYYNAWDGDQYNWLQVAINQPVLDYVIKRRHQLTVLEAGVLYGYPASACIAYAGLSEKTWFDKNLAEFFLSGVFSKDCTDSERRHFAGIWSDIAKASPKLARQAGVEYKDATT
ncbi:hypothetical protein [Streptomyces sp. NPDC003688]